MKGMFITFEGGEGAGKTTLIQRLYDHLQSQRFEVIVTREPGGTLIGDQIRKLLLDPENKKISPTTELLLYEAARAQHVGELITPALEKGSIVLCDRFCDSTTAYQGAGRSLSGENVDELNKLATGGLIPDLTFLVDLPPETGLARATLDGLADRIENESIEFHTRVREGFLTLAGNYPDRIHVIDALQSIEEISIQVRDIVASKLVDREG